MTMLRSTLKMIVITLAVGSTQGVVHCAEAGSDDALIQRLCNEMNVKTLAGDVDRTIELTNPKIVEIVGAEKMRELLTLAAAGNSAIHRDFLKDSPTHTVCPWKGTASYFDVVVDGKINADAAWYYPETKDAANNIKGFVAFWHGVQVVA